MTEMGPEGERPVSAAVGDKLSFSRWFMRGIEAVLGWYSLTLFAEM
jgi:hypothetical protein